jgi:2,3-bisphosphoglycerate-independent phosphoglycerate mutase
MTKKVALIIMDGWGHGPSNMQNAIAQAHTPFIDSLYKNYPHAELLASGENVGLPNGQMGNSEVGHLNLGAGRIVYQELGRIHKAIKDKTLNTNKVLVEGLKYAKENNKAVHLLGLVSDGGVHSHILHLQTLCDIAKEQGVDNVNIHAFMDGRDTDPKSGLQFIEQLEKHLKNSVGKIATIIGRYYAMDRDKRWERIKLAYDLMVNGIGEQFSSAVEAIKASYNEGITDEFIKPIIINKSPIKEGDVVICYNFRTDRCREITESLTQQAFPEQGMKPLSLYYITMTKYDEHFKGVKVMYEKDDLKMTLGEVIAKAGKKQIRIAETEKYPHVTFFFSGGREDEFIGEKRIMIPSPKVATYDLKPEMSACGIKDAIIEELKKTETDFICLNFANPDMVGHTGVFTAIVKAVETIDQCIKEVVEVGIANGYSFIITADHGNADYAVNEDGSPNTAHTKNPVPWFLVDKEHCHSSIKNGVLADIAPTILKLLNIPIPAEMTGKILI